jgi:hypothetical protein
MSATNPIIVATAGNRGIGFEISKNGRGEVLGQERLNGRAILVRFVNPDATQTSGAQTPKVSKSSRCKSAFRARFERCSISTPTRLSCAS